MAANKIHCKSIKGNNVEYKDVLRARSYADVLLGIEGKTKSGLDKDTTKFDWPVVTNRKSENRSSRTNSTIFVAKFSLMTKAKEIWDWFGVMRGYLGKETKITIGLDS